MSERKRDYSSNNNNHIDVNELRSLCEGKWRGIFSRFGVDVGNGRHMACPICPDRGEDRFRCDGIDTDGRYICNQCGAGTPFELLMKVKGWTFPETMKEVSDIVGMVEMPNNNNNKKQVDPAIALRQLVSQSDPLIPSDAVSRYLRSRGINLVPNDIRHCPNCYEYDSKKRFSAMLAAIRDNEGKLASIHRTYLSGSGKANIPAPRKMMPVIRPLAGCSVRLFSPEDKLFESGVLGVAEGLETSMAASQLFSVATWSCLSTSLLESFEPPKEYRHIVIFGDNDANFAGQKSAYILANKLYLKEYLVEVMIPDEVGDWNDVLLEKRKEMQSDNQDD